MSTSDQGSPDVAAAITAVPPEFGQVVLKVAC